MGKTLKTNSMERMQTLKKYAQEIKVMRDNTKAKTALMKALDEPEMIDRLLKHDVSNLIGIANRCAKNLLGAPEAKLLTLGLTAVGVCDRTNWTTSRQFEDKMWERYQHVDEEEISRDRRLRSEMINEFRYSAVSMLLFVLKIRNLSIALPGISDMTFKQAAITTKLIHRTREEDVKLHAQRLIDAVKEYPEISSMLGEEGSKALISSVLYIGDERIFRIIKQLFEQFKRLSDSEKAAVISLYYGNSFNSALANHRAGFFEVAVRAKGVCEITGEEITTERLYSSVLPKLLRKYIEQLKAGAQSDAEKTLELIRILRHAGNNETRLWQGSTTRALESLF
jgi:hypothetical protein